MAVDLRASKTGYLTLDQAAAINASDAALANEATFAAPEDKAALVERLRAYCEGFSA